MKPIGPARRLVAVMLAIVLGGAVLPGRIPGAAADPPVEAEGEDSGPSPGYWVVGRDGGVFAFEERRSSDRPAPCG